MFVSHERFYTQNGRRLIMIVDDELVNREMLSFILSKDYDIITAVNGRDALEKIKDNQVILYFAYNH